MNNANYLISAIKYKIPTDILNMAFLKPTPLNVIPISLDQAIKMEVITNKVCRDCNVIAGIEVVVSLLGISPILVEGGAIYKIGLGPTNGKIITSVLSVGYGYGYGTLLPTQATIASALIDTPVMTDVRTELIGVNTVYIEGYYATPITSLRCVVENDAELANLKPRVLVFYSKLCLAATKLYIYNNLTLKLSNGVVLQGVDMGRVKEIVDSYADAEELYMELLEQVPKVTILSDGVSKQRHLRMIVGSI